MILTNVETVPGRKIVEHFGRESESGDPDPEAVAQVAETVGKASAAKAGRKEAG